MSQRKVKVVAVDGPAGSGKSSICSLVAQKVGWTYVNTGAIYRAVGFVLTDSKLTLEAEHVKAVAEQLRWDGKALKMFHGSRDITPHLQTLSAGQAASAVAKIGYVREILLPLQRQMALEAPVGVILDGRDIGTVVFPDADLKIFLTASLTERARRRLAQVTANESAQGEISPERLQLVMREIEERDTQDSKRGAAPLKQADDALELDTSRLSFEDTIKTVIGMMTERGLLA